MVTKLAPRIVADPKIQFGRPVVEGTRVDVGTILRHLSAGWNLETVAREFALTREDILAAVAYAANVMSNQRYTDDRSDG
ncbi:MAG: DUF433 domain-containing protein [Chloroflexota bacterium]